MAGAGKSATAVLTADVTVTTGCINRGSKDQQPSGLQRTTNILLTITSQTGTVTATFADVTAP